MFLLCVGRVFHKNKPLMAAECCVPLDLESDGTGCSGEAAETAETVEGVFFFLIEFRIKGCKGSGRKIGSANQTVYQTL
jgi:hypothetical protein